MATFLVSTLLDEIAETTNAVAEAADGAGLSLREALAAADAMAGADTINFDASLTGGTLTLANDVIGWKSIVTINGDINGDGVPDIVISGDANKNGFGDAGDFQVFRGEADATLTGLDVRGGFNPGGAGGGVFQQSGSLTIANSSFGNNHAQDGGGIASDSTGVVTISNTTMTGNTASGNGGAFHITPNGDVIFTASEVFSNSADGNGGGIWVAGDATLDGTSFGGNSARGDAADNGGGAAYVAGGTLKGFNAEFTGNFAPGLAGSGGGIVVNGGGLELTNTTVSGNGSHRGGGGIEVVNGVIVILSNTTLDGNFSGPPGFENPGQGGGISITGPGSNVTLDGSTLSNNEAFLQGGGIWVDDGSSATILNSTISNNTANGEEAKDGGGGIFNNGGDIIIGDTTITGNTANQGFGTGGAIHNANDGTAFIVDTIFEDNEAFEGGAIQTLNGKTSISFGSSFTGNTATTGPGDITVPVIAFGFDPGETNSGFGASDTLLGFGGEDVLSGQGGANWIDGGDSNDTLTGGDNSDILIGGPGNDLLGGRDLTNTTNDGSGFVDWMFGGPGNDSFVGGDGQNVIVGGTGDDDVRVTHQSFVLLDDIDPGGIPVHDPAGRDTITQDVNFFWDQNNFGEVHQLSEGAGTNSTVIGSMFNGELIGNGQDNVIFGRGGSDTYRAGDGIDYLSFNTLGLDDANSYVGVDGVNTVIVEQRMTGAVSYDIVFDFEVGKDKADVSAYAAVNGLTSGADVIDRAFNDGIGNSYVVLDDGFDYLYFINVLAENLNPGDFIID